MTHFPSILTAGAFNVRILMMRVRIAGIYSPHVGPSPGFSHKELNIENCGDLSVAIVGHRDDDVGARQTVVISHRYWWRSPIIKILYEVYRPEKQSRWTGQYLGIHTGCDNPIGDGVCGEAGRPPTWHSWDVAGDKEVGSNGWRSTPQWVILWRCSRRW